MFSFMSLMVSGLTFWSLIYFEFICVYGVREFSNFILLHVGVQFSQHHLLKRLSFLHCIFLPPLSKIRWPYVHGFIPGFSILFHWSVFLFLCQYPMCIFVAHENPLLQNPIKLWCVFLILCEWHFKITASLFCNYHSVCLPNRISRCWLNSNHDFACFSFIGRIFIV